MIRAGCSVATEGESLVPFGAPPLLVLHRAGDNRSTWQRAVQSPADYLEVDVHLQGDGAVAHHDPLVHPHLTFLTHRNRLPRFRLPHRALWLHEARASGRLFLDIKDPRPGLIPALLRALDTAGTRDGAAASTPFWHQLDALADQAPGIDRYYTVRRREADRGAWESYLRCAGDGRGGSGVSLHRRLATPERLRVLNDLSLRAICYTVNDYDAGLRLLDAGAGGLTSDRADLIARWRDRSAPAG